MQEANSPSVVMTLREAARFIRVSDKTLGEMAREGKIPCQKVGREWRFLREALQEWLSRPVDAKIAKYPDTEPASASKAADPLVQYQTKFTGFRDTAFVENRERALHRWVPWIAGFSASFVDGVIEKSAGGTAQRMTVLDPFAGVGTTLIEALKHGHNAVGFELNPYAALACKTKLNVLSYDVALLRERITAYVSFMKERSDNGSAPLSQPPQGFTSRVPFFSPSIERQVLFSLDIIRDEPLEWIRDLFRVALGSVMVGFSNYSYEPSLGTRAAAGKANIETADTTAIVARKLSDMASDIAHFQDMLPRPVAPPKASVFEGSYFDLYSRLAPESVDLVITSPPYLNNYHYVRNTRPQMYWLDMVAEPGDLKEMEIKSFGQFWQTLRAEAAEPLVPPIKELSILIDELRTRNTDRGLYGGSGWANYATHYFNDCERFCRITRGVMKSGAIAVVVIGNNILQGVEFQTDRFFAEIAERTGFEVVDLHPVRKKRTGSSIVNSSVRVGTVKERTHLYETAVELRASKLTT